jgi:hypothetical protein
MAVTAKYAPPLQVPETPAMRDRIKAVADAEEISQAEVCRQLFAMAIDERERISQERVAQ